MEATIREYNKKDKEQCLIAFKSNVPLYFTEDEIGQFENFLDNLSKGAAEKGVKRTHFFVVVFNNNVIGCGGFGDKKNKNIISLA